MTLRTFRGVLPLLQVLAFLSLVLGSCAPTTAASLPDFPPADAASMQATYFVATDGDDAGDGSPGRPWATIGHALTQVPDGSTVLVGPGLYEGTVQLRGRFEQGVTVRSAFPYLASLRGDTRVVHANGDTGEVAGITLEGFDISHAGRRSGPLVVLIYGGEHGASRITLRDNVIHDSADNDLLKISGAAHDILVEGNLFYNQSGYDEHIDVNGAFDILIQDNVFFNDRRRGRGTGHYVLIKDSAGARERSEGSRRVTVQRNVFLHWQGSSQAHFVAVGEDGLPYHEGGEVQIRNNLMIGDGPDRMHAPFGVSGGRDVAFEHNTVVGDLPARTFGAVLGGHRDNPPNENIALRYNLWLDPTGTMSSPFGRASTARNDGVELHGNLYWNGGRPVPGRGGDGLLDPGSDRRAVIANPRLPRFRTPARPRWDPASATFGGGARTIREAHERLVRLVAELRPDSPAVDAADGSTAEDDILGRPRDGRPDIGAFERGGG